MWINNVSSGVLIKLEAAAGIYAGTTQIWLEVSFMKELFGIFLIK